MEYILFLSVPRKPISVGWLLQENASQEWRLDNQTIFINQQVEPFLSTSLPLDQNYIVTLGDSFVRGDPVDPSNNYPSVLQNLLNKEFLRYSVVNLGVGGFGPDQEFRLFQRYLAHGNRPAIVVWSFYGNDIDENYTQSVFSINQNRLVSIDTRLNWIFLRQKFYDLIPLSRKLKLRSRIVNLVLFFFEYFKGAQVPREFRFRGHEWSLLKINAEIDEMEKLAQLYNFVFYPVLITPQEYYMSQENPMTPTGWALYDFRLLQSALKTRSQLFTLDFSFLSANDKTNTEQTNGAISSDYYSEGTRDPLPLGSRHFNERGYAIFAHEIFQLLKNDRAINN